jgi:rhodanese-related sulfurtransferase
VDTVFLQQNIMWIGLAAFSGGILLLKTFNGGGPAVTPIEATLLINREDALVVDVREQNEFSAGHIPNSRFIPLGQVKARLPELDKFRDRNVIVVCRSGNRSASACSTLRKHGFTKVFNLTGGIQSWEQASLPVTKK